MRLIEAAFYKENGIIKNEKYYPIETVVGTTTRAL